MSDSEKEIEKEVEEDEELNEVDDEEEVDIKNIINEDKYTLRELREYCKKNGIKGYSNLNKDDLKNKVLNHALQLSIGSNVKEVYDKDIYTIDILEKQYNRFRKYNQRLIKDSKEIGINFRACNMPEYISENIVKFILRSLGHLVIWNCIGDLQCSEFGKLECKCLASDGPSSFSPNKKESWTKIFFLDARNYLTKNHFILYCVNLSNTSDEWKNVMVNKTQTMFQQQLQGKRPRISWDKLYPQIKDYVDILFNDTFDTLINVNTVSTSQQEE